MVHLLNFLFNLYFEIKYQILYYFTKRESNIVDIQNAYLINKETKNLKQIDNLDCIKKIGHEIVIFFNDNLTEYILDIGFKWNKKDYRIQFMPDSKMDRIIFPFFSLNDIKTKSNNQIIIVEDESEDNEINIERKNLINQYCGPIGDFYESKNLGISISNLYSLKYKDFLFRDIQLKLEDLFLNEYEINSENQNKVFQFKRNLDDTKLNKYSKNEDYILKTYDRFNLDWKKIIVDIFNRIFCKKRTE
jgi:hypothetical protein